MELGKLVNALGIEIDRLTTLYNEDKKALLLELQTIHGFTGDLSDINTAYMSLYLKLHAMRAQAIVAIGKDMDPIFEPNFKNVAARVSLKSAIKAWPFAMVASDVSYTYDFSCSHSTCSVKEFKVIDD